MSTATRISRRLLSAEEFAKLPQPPDGSRQELVRGVVITMPPPGFRHGKRQLRIGALLDSHVRLNRLGQVVTETGVITERGPDSVRGPDVSFWSAQRLPLDFEPEVYPEIAADLTVEILSPGQSMRKLLKKLREYFKAGVRLVWVVDPKKRTVTVYRAVKEFYTLAEGDTIAGEDVIPGFECKVAEFFD